MDCRRVHGALTGGAPAPLIPAMTEPAPPPTLADLAGHAYGCNAQCLACRRFAKISKQALEALAAKAPALPAAAFAQRLKCRECGARGAKVQLASPNVMRQA